MMKKIVFSKVSFPKKYWFKKEFMPKMRFSIERWKYCVAMDIFVSSEGRIRTPDGELQTLCAKENYLYYKGKPVHRLVIQTFNPVPNYANMTVDHLDHNTRNNCLSNLEWVTREENLRRAQEDNAEHSPSNIVPAQDKSVLVKVNGTQMTVNQAKALMKTDPNLQKNKIDSILDRITVLKTKKYGNFTVKLCES